MGKQKGKSKGAQTPQMDAQIAKVQTALGEDTVSVDVIKRVLAAHSNNARAAANAILDGNYGGDAAWEEVKPKKTKPVVKDEPSAKSKDSWGEMTARAETRKGANGNDNVGSNGRHGDDKRKNVNNGRRADVGQMGPKKDVRGPRPPQNLASAGPAGQNKPRRKGDKPVGQQQQPQAPQAHLVNRPAVGAPVQAKPRPKDAGPPKANAWTPSGHSDLIKLPPGVSAPEKPPAAVAVAAPDAASPSVAQSVVTSSPSSSSVSTTASSASSSAAVAAAAPASNAASSKKGRDKRGKKSGSSAPADGAVKGVGKSSSNASADVAIGGGKAESLAQPVPVSAVQDAAVPAPSVPAPTSASTMSNGANSNAESTMSGGKVVFLPGFAPQGTPEEIFRFAPQGAGRRRQQHLQAQQQSQAQSASSQSNEGKNSSNSAQSSNATGSSASPQTQSDQVVGTVPAVPMMMPQGSYGMPFAMLPPQQYGPIVPPPSGFNPQEMAYAQGGAPQGQSSQSGQGQQQQGQQQQQQGQRGGEGSQPGPGAYPVPMGGQYGYPPYYQYPPQYSPQFSMMYGVQSSQQKKFGPGPGMVPAQYAQQYPYQGSGEQGQQGQQNHYFAPQMMPQGAAEYNRQFQMHQHQQHQQHQQQQQQHPSQSQQAGSQPSAEHGGGGVNYPMYSFMNPAAMADSKKGATPSPPGSGGGGNFYPFSFAQQQMAGGYMPQPLHQGVPPQSGASGDK